MPKGISIPKIWSKSKKKSLFSQVENIEDKIEHLNKRLDRFIGKYNELHSELHVSKNGSNFLPNRVIESGKNALSTAHYVRREIIAINAVPGLFSDQNFVEQVCKALSVTNIKVEEKD